MSQLSFSPSERVALFGKNCLVTQILDNKLVELRDDDLVFTRYSLDTLISHYLSGNLRAAPLPHPLSAVPPAEPVRRVSMAALRSTEEQRNEALRWHKLLARVQDDATLSPGSEAFGECCQELGFARPPSGAALRRKRARLRVANGDVSALLSRHFLRGAPGKPRFADEVGEIVDDVIRNVYLRAERAPLIDAYHEICRQLAQVNDSRLPALQLRVPSLSTVRRHVERMPAYQVYAARYGLLAAQRKFRMSTQRIDEGAFMSVVEIDHTPLDVFVIDDIRNLPLGRPRLTIAIEKKSRAIVGFDLGYDGNSAAATLHCLRHAMLPKEESDLSGPVSADAWPCMGMPYAILCDNGKEFHSEDFGQAMFGLKIEIAYAPARRPWFKGAVERVIRTVNHGFAHLLPGTTLSHFYKRKEGEDPTKWAVLTLSELRKLLVHWIVNIYMPTVHSRIKEAPLAAWKRHFEVASLRFPATAEEIDLACCVTDARQLQHYGVELLGLRSFNNPTIQEIRRRHQHESTVSVRVRYNDRRLSRIWVEDPDDGFWIEVVNSDPETIDLSAFEARAINRVVDWARKRGSSLSIAEAKQLLRQEIDRLRATRLIRNSRRAARLLGIEESATTPQKPVQIATKPTKASRKAPVHRVASQTPETAIPQFATSVLTHISKGIQND